MDIKAKLYSTRGAARLVAERLGITAAAVSQWRKRGIPADRVAEVEQILREIAAQQSKPEVGK